MMFFCREIEAAQKPAYLDYPVKGLFDVKSY
jgi:hypothetical protein